MMTREEAVKLLRACAVLYYGADAEMIRLAENEFSGCAGTQRTNNKELDMFLKQETKRINVEPAPPQPTSSKSGLLGNIIRGHKLEQKTKK